MKASAKANAAAAQGMALSKDGYTFDPANRHWKLNKDVTVAASLPDNFDVAAALGFRSTLQRYAEEMSARHTENMSVRFHKFVRESECNEVSVTALMNWRAALGPEREWHLGGLKGFLLAWHDYGFSGSPTMWLSCCWVGVSRAMKRAQLWQAATQKRGLSRILNCSLCWIGRMSLWSRTRLRLKITPIF